MFHVFFHEFVAIQAPFSFCDRFAGKGEESTSVYFNIETEIKTYRIEVTEKCDILTRPTKKYRTHGIHKTICAIKSIFQPHWVLQLI
jgi:hypothetical protein